MKKIVILGSTGSIGTNTLDVLRREAGKFRVVGLAAGRNVELLREQVREFKPAVVTVRSEEDVRTVREEIGEETRVLWGDKGLKELAALPEAEIVVSAIPGVVGLLPTLAAIEEGKTIALASKEILVAAGDLVMEAAVGSGSAILPVDSEHSAVFQCLRGEKTGEVRKIILTASGGPFLGSSGTEMEKVTPEDALAHPRWKMGKKVSLDSATLMNKGLEVLEAHHLFKTDLDRIQVVIHPQSVVHAMVEMRDGSILAQLGLPDMRLPIQYALNYPERSAQLYGEFDIYRMGELTFDEPDWERFPALKLAYGAGETGGTMPVVLNAANEAAGEAFLDNEIPFPRIMEIVGRVMESHETVSRPDLSAILEADRWARRETEKLVKSQNSNHK